jgi:predicted permease
MIELIMKDLRYAARSLVRRPALALPIVLTLALGIGANSAIFSAIDTVLLKPLPYPTADRLVAVYEISPGQRANGLAAPVRFIEWSRMSRAFEGFSGCYFENVTDTTGPLPESAAAMRTASGFFSLIGTPAAIGRTFTADEERFGGPAAVVVSDAFWRTRLNADPAVVGRTLTLSDTPRTIVGVMPPSFRYPSARTQIWIPAQAPAGLLNSRVARFYTGIARMKPGVTLEAAQDDLSAMQRRLGEQFPGSDKGWGASINPLKEEQVGGVRRSLWLLFGAVVLVLMAACGNIACLLLSDSVRRDHELAVRAALGAARRILVRQLLFEGALLAVAGSILGLVLARWSIDALRAAATTLPRAAELSVDGRLVAFTLLLGVATTLLFALTPALKATGFDVAARLARGARGQVSGRQLLQRALVTAQVALAVVLLVGAGLLLRSFSKLQQVSPGFDPNGVLTFRLSASWSERPAAVAARQAATLERLRSIPGVETASLGTVLPAFLNADYPPGEFSIAGRGTDDRTFAVLRSVSAGYFRTLRIPIQQGETCRDDVRVDAPPKAVVSQSFANRFFPGGTPIGERVSSVPRGIPAEIVGIAGDVREQSLLKEPQPAVYFCGLSPFYPDPHYLVRVDPTRAVSMSAVREALREIEPRRAVYSVLTLADALSLTMSQPRLNTVLLSAFAAMALTLAGLGLYGVLAQFVLLRRREMALRIALGARASQVLSRVVRHAAVVAGAGLAVGLVASVVLSRFMAALVFGIDARDPLTFAAIPIVLAAIAAAATIVPARRAVRVEPMRALREE